MIQFRSSVCTDNYPYSPMNTPGRRGQEGIFPMDKIRRNERMSAMLKMLTDAPNRIFTLNSFCDLFGTAKSTMSEDVAALQHVLENYGLGQVDTVTGAAGGVRYRPVISLERAGKRIGELCRELSGTERVLPGGFLYYSDVLSNPEIVDELGKIIATRFYEKAPDFVLTMETTGIPVAYATANALGTPVVIARHSSKVYEGSAVNINYVSGSGAIEIMSLSRRAVRDSQRALIVDDFLRGGGTARGMVEMMREFNVEVAGLAFVMAAGGAERKRLNNAVSLMNVEIRDGEIAEAVVTPADWLA